MILKYKIKFNLRTTPFTTKKKHWNTELKKNSQIQIRKIVFYSFLFSACARDFNGCRIYTLFYD